MSKILRNKSDTTAVELADTGVTVPPNTNYTIPPQDYLLFAASSDVIRALATSALTLNDGGNDVGNLSDAIDIIKGWSPFSPSNYDGVVVYDDSLVVGPTVGLDFRKGIQAELDGDKVKVQVTQPTISSFVLSLSDIQNKHITLPTAPEFPATVRILPDGGPEQINGIDFECSGNLVSWQNKGLDGFLDEGDTITVVF